VNDPIKLVRPYRLTLYHLFDLDIYNFAN